MSSPSVIKHEKEPVPPKGDLDTFYWNPREHELEFLKQVISKDEVVIRERVAEIRAK